MQQHPSDQATSPPASTKDRRGRLPRLPSWARNSRANITGSVTHTRGEFLRGSLNDFMAVMERKPARKETFEQAVERLKLTEDALLLSRGSLVVGSRLSYMSAAMLLIVCAYFVVQGGLLQVGAAAALFSFAMVCGFVRAFRAWQIRIRRLATFKEFLRSADDWIV